jgi:hypothetical protein
MRSPGDADSPGLLVVLVENYVRSIHGQQFGQQMREILMSRKLDDRYLDVRVQLVRELQYEAVDLFDEIILRVFAEESVVTPDVKDGVDVEVVADQVGELELIVELHDRDLVHDLVLPSLRDGPRQIPGACVI